MMGRGVDHDEGGLGGGGGGGGGASLPPLFQHLRRSGDWASLYVSIVTVWSHCVAGGCPPDGHTRCI